MIRSLFPIGFAFILALGSLASAGEWRLGWECCAEKRGVAGSDSASKASPRQYAPNRRVDVRHLKLDLTPNFEKRNLTGIAYFSFSPIGKPLHEFQLDAVDLRIHSVNATRPLQSYHVHADHVSLHFAEEIPVGEEVTVTIEYFAEPQNGLFFRTPEMGYLPGDTHLWTQGEPQHHRHWFPSYDYPNERFTTEVICRVPSGMTVLSNGVLLDERKEDGLAVFHWHQQEPHVNYLVSVVAGYFERLEDRYRDIPLAFLTPPSDFAQAKNSFQDTKTILGFFEEEIGVPYPWAKYYSVCVQGFPYGGMENTSVTTLTTRSLFSEDTETLYTSRHLDAHEIAHQWFGNLVTCKDWSHLWLNEGFATYYTELYEENQFGRDHLLYRMQQNAEQVFGANDDKPIAWRSYSKPWEQFDYRAYPKGAWVLHMLRSQLGVDLYREAVRTYLDRHRNDVAVTEDLNSAFEDVSGRSFDQFFDQWVYHGGHPRLKVTYSWDEKRKQAKLKVSQNQEINERVLLFHFPLSVRFHLEGVSRDFTVQISDQAEDFYFDLPEAPKAVRIDYDSSLHAEIEVDLPKPLIDAQASLADDMMGRYFAVRKLGKREDSTSLGILANALSDDPFFGVRIEVAKALGNRQSGDALQVLLEAEADEDARVHREVASAVSRYYRIEAKEWLQQLIETEKNPGIVATAIGGLAKFGGEDVEGTLLAALQRQSFQHRIAVAAINALGKQDGTKAVPALHEHLAANPTLFTDRDLGAALKTLGFLARNLDSEPRDDIRRFIAEKLTDPREQLHVPAVEALQRMEDSRALAILEPLIGDSDHPSRLTEAARKAVESLNGRKQQPQELRDLRKEVLDLKSELEKIRESMEALRKQAEAN